MFRTFGYYLNGAILDETAGYARGPSTVEPVPDATGLARYKRHLTRVHVRRAVEILEGAR